MPSLETIHKFLQDRTGEIEPLSIERAIACWNANLTGKPEDFARMAELEKRMLAIFSRVDEYKTLEKLHRAPALEEDPLTRRQVDLLYRSYRSAQGDQDLLRKIVDLESDLMREINNFRAEYQGEKCSNNALEQILKTTRSSAEAREAWEALKQVGAMAAPRIAELVTLRNRHASDLGSANYYAFALELGEIDQDWLFRLLDELKAQSDPLFERMKTELDARLAAEFGIAVSDLRPWHYRNPFFQEMPSEESVDLDAVFQDKNLEELTERYYQGLGMDIRPILEISDLYEKEGKDQHAFCIGVDTPRDVRVLCNVRPNERWMSTMLHEFGHAVYDRYIDAALPFFLRGPAHTMTTEAIAMLNERMLSSAEYLVKIGGVEPGRARQIETVRRRHQARKYLVFLRWVLVMTHFERAMYENPGQDLCLLWWKNVERFQWLDGAERHGSPDWASKMHLAGAPVYYQNYLLGEMTASQFMAALRARAGLERDGFIGNPKVGAFFRDEVFRHGASKIWNERLRDATGEPLNPRHFLDDLNG